MNPVKNFFKTLWAKCKPIIINRDMILGCIYLSLGLQVLLFGVIPLKELVFELRFEKAEAFCGDEMPSCKTNPPLLSNLLSIVNIILGVSSAYLFENFFSSAAWIARTSEDHLSSLFSKVMEERENDLKRTEERTHADEEQADRGLLETKKAFADVEKRHKIARRHLGYKLTHRLILNSLLVFVWCITSFFISDRYKRSDWDVNCHDVVCKLPLLDSESRLLSPAVCWISFIASLLAVGFHKIGKHFATWIQEKESQNAIDSTDIHLI